MIVSATGTRSARTACESADIAIARPPSQPRVLSLSPLHHHLSPTEQQQYTMSSYDIYRDSVGSMTDLARYSQYEPVAFGEEGASPHSSSDRLSRNLEPVGEFGTRRQSRALSPGEKEKRQSRRASTMSGMS